MAEFRELSRTELIEIAETSEAVIENLRAEVERKDALIATSRRLLQDLLVSRDKIVEAIKKLEE